MRIVLQHISSIIKHRIIQIQKQTVKKISATVPIHTQVKGLQIFLKMRKRLFNQTDFPKFIEKKLPDISTLKLEEVDLSNPFLYRQKQAQAYYRRLRDEAPVHYQANSPFGAFWSITRYEDIVFVDKNHQLFSAEPIILLGNQPKGMEMEMFIAMDPPKHNSQRQAVQGVVAPQNLKELESLIRIRTIDVLDHLPMHTPFDWVREVSIELTARMLALLLDFPYEKRHKLVEWSDGIMSFTETTGGENNKLEESLDMTQDMAKQLSDHWHDKAQKFAREERGFDLINLLLSNDETKDMIKRPMEFLGNFALLIVGGNDTTRNSMSGGVYAMHQFPKQWQKLKQNPTLVPNMVSEIIRWQTPIAYMRRVATQDVHLHGQTIKKGDKVVMWYASGNFDERVIDQADEFIIDRKNARNHLSFGFGIHRCMGNRLAEMQLRILWEEILKRFDEISVLEEPTFPQSNIVRGYHKMMVQLSPKVR